MDNNSAMAEILLEITCKLESAVNELDCDHWIYKLVKFLTRTKELLRDSNPEIKGFLLNVLTFVNLDILKRISWKRFEPALYLNEFVHFLDFLENYLRDMCMKRGYETVIRKLKVFSIEFCYYECSKPCDEIGDSIVEVENKLHKLEEQLLSKDVVASNVINDMDRAVRLLLKIRADRNYNLERNETTMNDLLTRFLHAFQIIVFDIFDFQTIKSYAVFCNERRRLEDSICCNNQNSSNFNEDLIYQHFLHPFTRHWVLNSVQTWLQYPKKSVYYVSSNKGFGKTCLAVDIFKNYESNVLAFNSLDEADLSVDCAIMLKNIWIEIVMNSQALKDVFLSDDHSSVDRPQTGEEFLQFIANNDRINSARSTNISFLKNLVIIDGVDKLSCQECNLLARFVKLMNDYFGNGVLFFLTFDNQSPIKENLENLDMIGLNLNSKENINYHLNDVDILISKLFTAIVSKKLILSEYRNTKTQVSHFNVDDRNVNEILGDILKTCAGSFLYVKMFFMCFEHAIDECNSNIKSALIRTNDNFRRIAGGDWQNNQFKFNQSINAYRFSDGSYRVNFDISSNANTLYHIH